MNENWIKSEVICRLYLMNKAGLVKDLKLQKETTAQKIGVTYASVDMACANFKYLDTNGQYGLSNYNKTQEMVYLSLV